MIVTDASDLTKGAVLSQYEDSDKKCHPVAFYSKKFSPAELNYDIHDKEMVVIVNCFKEWRYMLCGSPNRVVVYTDLGIWNISRPPKYLTEDKQGGLKS